MSVEFEDPVYRPSAAPKAGAGKPSPMSRAVIDAGLAKDEKGSQVALLLIFVVLVIAIGFVFFHAHRSLAPVQAPPEPANVR